MHQRQALGAVGQHALALVEAVEGGQAEARVVALLGVGAVGQAEVEVAVGVARAPAEAPHHQLPGQRTLDQRTERRHLELHAQADRAHALGPELALLARALVGREGAAQQQRAAVGALAPAVAVAVDEAVQVEQRTRAHRAGLAHLAAQVRLEAVAVRRDHRLRRLGLALQHEADLFAAVEGQRDGPAQRHLLRAVAAHRGVLAVEEGVRGGGLQRAVQLHAALGEVGRQLPAGQRHRGQVGRQRRDDVVLAVQEGQPARLRLLDDADLDAVQQRQPLAAQPRRLGLRVGVVRRRVGLVDLFAKARVAFEHDARGAPPLRQPERPRAHRVRQQVVGIGLHHLARHCAGELRRGPQRQEARRRLGQPHLEAVAVEHAQAVDGGVVGERRARAQRRAAQLRQAQDLRVLELVEVFGAQRGVVEALDAVDVVGRHQLARAAAEHGIVGEEDAGADREDEMPEVGRHLGHRRRRQRHQLRRPRQVLVGQRRLEDVRHHAQRDLVRRHQRVETGLGDVEGHAQRARHGPGVRRLHAGADARQRTGLQQRAALHRHRGAPAYLVGGRRAASMSTMCHQSFQKVGRR